MYLQAVQNRCIDAWARFEPYAVPVAVSSGVALIVNQLWGRVAAVCFLAGVVGIGVSFPILITELSKGGVYLQVAQLVVITVLPMFGFGGVVGAVGLSALLVVVKDFRLYALRKEVEDIKNIVAVSNKKLDDEIKKTQARIDDFRNKETIINGKLSSLHTVDESVARADKLLCESKEKRDYLDSILKEHQEKTQERQKSTKEIKNDISSLKKSVEEIRQQVQQLTADAATIIAEAEQVLGRGGL